MRELIKNYAGIITEHLDLIPPVYEFGSLQVPEQVGYADLRSLFPGKEFVGCDMREGPGVDKILDLHNIELQNESVGSVLCLDTLEHVEYPHKALEEIYRILKPGGIVVISSVMDFPIHDYPYDYWRFTPEGFKSLLKPFKSNFVESLGQKDYPHTVIGLGIKDDSFNLNEIILKTYEWKYYWEKQPFYRTIDDVFIEKLSFINEKCDRILENTTKIEVQEPPESEEIQKLQDLKEQEKSQKAETTTRIIKEINRFINKISN